MSPKFTAIFDFLLKNFQELIKFITRSYLFINSEFIFILKQIFCLPKKVEVFQGPHFSGSRFSGSRILGSGSGSRVRVQVIEVAVELCFRDKQSYIYLLVSKVSRFSKNILSNKKRIKCFFFIFTASHFQINLIATLRVQESSIKVVQVHRADYNAAFVLTFSSPGAVYY